MCATKKLSEVSLSMPGIPPNPLAIRSPRIRRRNQRPATSQQPAATKSLAVLMLVVSLLAGSAIPVAGRDGEPDQAALYSACAGPAAESAGFGDVVGSFAEDAVNCLAHYEITLGTDPGVFSPAQVVPRWQMALFLARAASPAGIAVPKATDQGFTDLRVGAKTRDAINQLAALDIMEGTSATTFAPFDPVTRRQMAVLLARFLSVAPTGPGGADIDVITSDDDNFGDLANVAFDAVTAIRKLFEMGVTRGTTQNTFSPAAPVSRAQMAVFITRMLAHTNARPVGLVAQAEQTEVFKDSDVRVSITLRDEKRLPRADQVVDIFTAEDPTRAFDKDGRCTKHVLPVSGGEVCAADGGDNTTDASGNITISIDVGDVDAVRIWAWTGNEGEEFDADTTAPSIVDVTTLSTASALEVSDDMAPTAKKLRFGDTVTFTFRLVDDDGDPVPRAGHTFSITVAESRDNGRTFDRSTISKETGVDGAAEVTFRHSDPSGAPGDVARLDLDIRNAGDLAVNDETTIGMVDDDRSSGRDPLLDWADEPEETSSLVMSVTREYRIASTQGGGAGGTVRGTLTDQYGDPVVREQITFTSSDPRGVPRGVRRTTNTMGVATLHYQRNSAAGSVERITGRHGSLVATARQFWAAEATSAVQGSGEVRVLDKDNDTVIVVAANDVLLIRYDVGDHFNIGTKRVDIAAFEREVSEGDTLAYVIAGSGSAVNIFTLSG